MVILHYLIIFIWKGQSYFMLAFNLLSYFGVFLFAMGFPLLLFSLVRKVSLDKGIFPIIIAGIMVFGGIGLN